jgi:class 3 adenylate cyclase
LWFIDRWVSGWGTPDTITGTFFVPSQEGNEEYALYLRRFERAAATPASLRTLMMLNLEIDVQPALPLIACPTLVTHASGDLVVPVAMGRELAEAIPGARFVEYDCPDHFPTLAAVDEGMDAIEEFLTGELRATPTDRVLATVLFTDIVGSTARAAELGDAAWHAALDRHEHTMRRVLLEHRGTLVNTTGDGLVATFDSPARGIRCARALCESAAAQAMPIRAGVHTGEIERRGKDIAGIAVHIGARVASLACAGEVLVSGSVPPLVVGSGIAFDDRGEHQLKGVPGEWRVYAVS